MVLLAAAVVDSASKEAASVAGSGVVHGFDCFMVQAGFKLSRCRVGFT